jgi:Cyclic nucleotide-binding domain
MAINASLPLVAGGASSAPSVAARGLNASPAPDAAWVERIRRAALVVFPALIVFCVLVPRLAGRVFWTVAIASLPLFFVIAGYHRWRRICPLAYVAQLSTRFGRGGRRRAGRWMQAHFYHVSFAMLVGSLWLRLVATNGDGYALAIFLVALALVALATDSIFTGKTWCNYVCPISFVEKIYTEPRSLRATPNSQCQKCTACKPACPDINEENGYWKDVLLPAKRHVYFAFPGVVFTFYFYYYLQAGTWEYYFGGRWTNQIGLVRTAFLPGVDVSTAGLYFWPALPRAVAAAVTLLLGAAVSFSIFAVIERTIGGWLIKTGRASDQAAVRHVMFTLAAFTAFLTFYSFAGAPTLRLVPSLPHFFQLLVVTTATLFLTRRLLRRQTAFVEETLARQIIAKWPWADTPPPRDLREAFLIHRIRSQSHEEARLRALELYKEAVRDTLNSGIVSRTEIHRLETIRDQMHISQADHERIMAELAEEERGVASAIVVSPEKHLQLETYAQALAVHLASRGRAGAAAIDLAAVRRLREEYAVTEEEHAAVLDRLVRRDEGIAAHLLDVPAAIEAAFAAIDRVEMVKMPSAQFLVFLLQRRAERAADGLLRTVGHDSPEIRVIRDGLLSRDPAARTAAVAALGSRVSPAVAERLSEAQQRARQEFGEHPDRPYCLRCHFTSPDPYIRAAALYTLESADKATEADYAALETDEHPVVREVAAAGRRFLSGESDGLEPTTLVKMIGLKSIDVFAMLEPEELALLAREGRESWFTPNEVLCREGEMGDEVFVLLAGDVTILRRDGDVDRVVAVEGPGSVIGELAVLDPAPRNATVVASYGGARTLRLDGSSFRQVLTSSPAVSEVIIRMLARRVRAQDPSAKPVADPSLQRR